MKNMFFFLFAAVVFITAACQREGRVTGVRLDRNEVTLNFGENFDLTATVIPADAVEKKTYWASSDPGRVSVSAGRITGVAATDEDSPVIIRVSTMEGEFEDRCRVTVLPPVITITAQPAAITNVTAGSITGSLSVSASVTGGATVRYQWYSNRINSSNGGTVLSGGAGTNFTIPATLTAGVYYYFCEVSASGGTKTVRSNVATVIVNEPSFFDIVQSTYTATGTPFPTTPPAPNWWTGRLYPWDDDFGKYYEITNWTNTANWASLEHPLWLDYVNGKLILDDFTKVGEDGDYDLYFGANYFSGSYWEAVLDYSVSYNKTTRTLDFSGTYNGYQVYVGVWGEHYITGEWTVFVDTQVRDAKLVLTPVSSSALKSVRDVHPGTSRKSLSTTGSVKRTATRSQSVKAPSGPQNRTSKSVR